MAKSLILKVYNKFCKEDRKKNPVAISNKSSVVYTNDDALYRDLFMRDYRYTEFKDIKNIIVKAETKGIKGDISKALENIKQNMEKRINTQPLEYKNAGSVFKNPPDLSAGYLIEQAGLKGFTIGGAKVSLKHANFIINYHNAHSCDIISLIDAIKEKVKKEYGIELQLEQIVVRWDNNGE